MGDGGEEVFAPLLARGSADLAIAFEPGEAARVLPYLAPGGTLVTATTPIQPVSAALSQTPYRAEALVRRLGEQLASAGGSLVAIDDAAVHGARGQPQGAQQRAACPRRWHSAASAWRGRFAPRRGGVREAGVRGSSTLDCIDAALA